MRAIAQSPLALAVIIAVLLADRPMDTTQRFPLWNTSLPGAMLIRRLAVVSASHAKAVGYSAFTALVRTDSGIDLAAHPAGTEHT